VSLIAEAAILNNFRCAQTAEYRHGDRDGCMKGTRGAVLDEIELWTEDFDRPPVYWLNGLAGTGKTTIAQTIAERMFTSGQLGASFFCSRDFLDRSNLQLIFPTLAVQLARKFAEFRSIVVPLVQSDPGIVDESLYHQMEKLIVGPLTESDVSTLIIIDALDECRDDKPASAILSVLGQFVSKIPKVKFFLTGRPERRIREGFRLPRMVEATDVFILHEVEPRQIDGDIRLFFKQSFSELASRWHELENWPTKGQLDLLCERAAGLFAYAVATVKFIDHRNNDPEEQLDRLLKSSESSAREGRVELRGGMSLNALYMTILREAFGRDDPEDDPTTRSVLGAIVLAANPLSPSTIATLLGFRTKSVSLRLSSIHSLLILQEDVNHPVRPFHKSFPDFIIDPTRCADQRFHISPPIHHSELLIGCLELMNRRLEKNMCKLLDGAANSEVADLRDRIEKYIDHSLRYACESWHKHLVDLRTVPYHASRITSTLHRFLEEKLLFWLEVLSVLGTLRDAVDALQVAAKRLEVRRASTHDRLSCQNLLRPKKASPTLDLVNDYFRFVTGFFEGINTSAPHIYHSALPQSPRTSIVRRLYERYAHPLVRVARGVPTSWDPTIATIKRSNGIQCIAWSPCSRFIAISSQDSAGVQILDAVTLKQLNSFTPPHRSTQLLAFTPTNRLLMWLGGDPRVFTSWDIQTGVQASEIPIEGPPHARSITHSGCGTMLGVLFHGNPSVINTYDTISGTLMHCHSVEGVRAGTFWTHDNCVRFTTFRPGFITICEVGFASQLPPTEVESLPTPNDFDTNLSLFLPVPPRLAFIGPGKTVLVWDAQYSKLLLDSTDVGNPNTMTFSSDGHFFTCGTFSPEIYLWKESPTGYILHRKLIYDDVGVGYCEPFLSPDGQSIIAYGGGHRLQLNLWRTTDSSSPSSSLPTQGLHPTDRFVIGFSPDGLLAAAARLLDNTATVFDLKSGATQLIIDAGHCIHGLGLAGSAVVAVISYGTVVTWNLPTGPHVIDARVDSSDGVRTTKLDLSASIYELPPDTVSISPDLNYIAVTDGGGVFNSWDVPAGKSLMYAWTGSWAHSSWFTPDGRELWFLGSGRGEGWAIVRDSETNITKLEPFGPTRGPPEGHPWQPPRGCRVTGDGWVLNSTGKRLLWLPPRWRSHERAVDRVWSGRFLALLHAQLPEVVVLELLVE